MAKIGRNDLCPCGSKNKYKKCCGSHTKRNLTVRLADPKISEELKRYFEQAKAAEMIRVEQQGLGKPIMATPFKSGMAMGIGNRVYVASKGKTFPDFLASYLPLVLGKEWFSNELKLTTDRHPIVEWYFTHREHQKKHAISKDDIFSMPETGMSICYLGLTYNLYLLEHNVELQQRFINRLKDRNNFQGAYYELIVANCLIRSGFKLTLEDETDDSQKHCEFSAISKTGKKYWVEAKARSVVGVLCKNKQNGTTDKDATGRMSEHISNALKKPATEARLIFVDINDPSDNRTQPVWIDRATNKLLAKERNLKPNESAYVFVTNMNFHYHLDSEQKLHAILAFGLGIPDFAKAGTYTFIEAYRIKQKHIDVHEIMDSLREYPKIPNTIDGSLPSESLSSNPQNIKIGETYLFDDIGIATITTATANEVSGDAYFGTSNGQIITKKLSKRELDDYKNHGNAFFGTTQEQGRFVKTPYEFFEHMVEIHSKHSEESILNKIAIYSDADELRRLSHEERVLIYCERISSAYNR